MLYFDFTSIIQNQKHKVDNPTATINDLTELNRIPNSTLLF